jgi:Flp pilus assembly pilin Flp
VEYALLLALIAAVIVVIVAALGQTVSGAFATVNNAI